MANKLDKATILASIEEANTEHGKNFAKLQKIGDKIGNNLKAIKDANQEMEQLKKFRAALYNDKDGLKDELTKLKVREGEILATKAAFEKMLDGTK